MLMPKEKYRDKASFNIYYLHFLETCGFPSHSSFSLPVHVLLLLSEYWKTMVSASTFHYDYLYNNFICFIF